MSNFNFTTVRAPLLESFEQLWAPCHYTVDLSYDSSPLSHRCRDTLRRACPHIANSEDAGAIGLER
jgi:hypothetical protein